MIYRCIRIRSWIVLSCFGMEQMIRSFHSSIRIRFIKREMENIDEQRKAYFLLIHTDTLMYRLLMFWHGTDDTIVPFDHSYTFYKDVKEKYKTKRNIHFVKEENRDHKGSRFAMLETVKWFEKFL